MDKFIDIMIDCTKHGRKIKKGDYLEEGKYPVIDQGQKQCVGYSNEEEGLFNDVPAIIFGDHTRVIKYIDEPFFLGADGVKVLRSKDNNVDYRYLYYALRNVKIENTGYNRHFKWLKESKIRFPELNKQQKIATVLGKVERVIELKEKELKELDLLIKSRFIELFGYPVSNTMNWDVAPMGEVAPTQKYNGSFDDSVWLLNLDMVEAQSGKVLDYNIVEVDEVGNSTGAFDTSNVLYSKLRPYLNKVVIPERKGFATSELVPLKPNQKLLNREYLAYMLRSDEFVTMITEKVAGAKMPRVSMNDFRGFSVPLPPANLQNQFSRIVNHVDKLKVEVQKSLDETQLLFDSLMQEYFQ